MGTRRISLQAKSPYRTPGPWANGRFSHGCARSRGPSEPCVHACIFGREDPSFVAGWVPRAPNRQPVAGPDPAADIARPQAAFCPISFSMSARID